MKKFIILILLAFLLIPVKAQIFPNYGKVLENDSVFTAGITGTDTTFVRKLRAPVGALVWYEFTSFATNSTATIVYGESIDGIHFQLPAGESPIPITSASIMYANGDTVMGQNVRASNIVGQYWMSTLYKGNSTADTLIIHYAK